MIQDFKWCGNDFSIKFNEIKQSSTSSCVINHGPTTILVYCQVGEWCGFEEESVKLNIEYSERYYSINKIPSGFNKKEARNKENEILIAKLIDRSIRYSISDTFRFAININCIVLSYHKSCPIEPLCIIGASACLYMAGVPCSIVGACSFAYNDTWSTGNNGKHNLIIAGNYYGITSIKSSGIDLTAQTIYDCVKLSFTQISSILDFTQKTIDHYFKANIKPIHIAPENEIKSISLNGKELIEAFLNNNQNKINEIKDNFIEKWQNKDIGNYKWRQILKTTLRSYLIWNKKRLDNRSFEDIRPIALTSKFLKTHGSCLLKTNNNTVLSVLTISNGNEVQIFDSLDLEQRKFVVHYNDTTENYGFKKEILNADFIRSSFKHHINDDRFIRIVVEVLDADCVEALCVCSVDSTLRNGGVKISERISSITIGGMLNGSGCEFLADTTKIESFASDIKARLSGTKLGITSWEIDSILEFFPYTLVDSALNFGFASLQNILKNTGDHHYTSKHIEHNIKNDQNIKNLEYKDNIHTSHVKRFEQKETIQQSDLKHIIKQDKHKQIEAGDAIYIKLKQNIINILKDIGQDELSKKIDANSTINNNNVAIYGPNRLQAINKLITIAYEDQNKKHLSLFYMKVSKLTDIDCDLISLDTENPMPVKLKKQNLPSDIKENDCIIVSKNSRSWSFFAKP